MKKRIYSLLALGIALVSGCLITECKSLVMIIPADSNEIHVYYAFEGISVDKDYGTLETAANELKDLQHDNFSFFVSAETLKRVIPDAKVFSNENPEDSPLTYCRFEKLRFFVNSERKRPLCADRCMTITDRTGFENSLNRSLKSAFAVNAEAFDEEKALKEFRESNGQMLNEDGRRIAESLGMGTLHKIATVISEMYADLDVASLRRIHESAKTGFRWVRIEDGSIGLAIPVTEDFANCIVANPKAPKWQQELEALVRPVEFKATQQGLMMTAGKPAVPVRLTYKDSRSYKPTLEKDLWNCAGSPSELRVKDQPATIEILIEEFVKAHPFNR